MTNSIRVGSGAILKPALVKFGVFISRYINLQKNLGYYIVVQPLTVYLFYNLILIKL